MKSKISIILILLLLTKLNYGLALKLFSQMDKEYQDKMIARAMASEEDRKIMSICDVAEVRFEGIDGDMVSFTDKTYPAQVFELPKNDFSERKILAHINNTMYEILRSDIEKQRIKIIKQRYIMRNTELILGAN